MTSEQGGSVGRKPGAGECQGLRRGKAILVRLAPGQSIDETALRGAPKEEFIAAENGDKGLIRGCLEALLGPA